MIERNRHRKDQPLLSTQPITSALPSGDHWQSRGGTFANCLFQDWQEILTTELEGSSETPGHGQALRFEIVPDRFDVVEFGRVFGQPFDGEPVGRAARAAIVALLTWIGPLSSTMTTGFVGRPGLGPYRPSSVSKSAMKSVLRLVRLGLVHDELAGGVIERSQKSSKNSAPVRICVSSSMARAATIEGPKNRTII